MNILPSDLPRDLSPFIAAYRRQNVRLADLTVALETLALARKLQCRAMWGHPLERADREPC
jgi:hypothetical protein